MIATISDSGKQFRISEGDVLKIDLREGAEIGSTIVFDRILLLESEGKLRIGQPFVDGVNISATVLGEVKNDRVIRATFRRRKSSRRRVGHRQVFLKVKIEKIEG